MCVWRTGKMVDTAAVISAAETLVKGGDDESDEAKR